ncbi:MAG: OmpH family outer membrane protein [Fulvivirga sp.]
MKNLSLVLNIVLIIAVAILFYFQFKSSESPAEEKSIMSSAAYSVAYINSDSVLQNYDYFAELQEDLQAKSQKLESEYQNRAQGLQKEFNDYQRNINNLTIGQAKALEEDLMKKQQNLRVYQESLSQELLKEEARISQELYKRVTGFLNEYSEDNGLQLVVKYNQGSDVLYANDSMNITNDVIKGLNDAYASEKSVTNESDSLKN